MASPEFPPMKRRKTFPPPEESPGAALFGRSPATPPNKAEDAHAAISSPRISPEAGPSSTSQDITFICPDREKCLMPFASCQNWQGMKSLIRSALGPDPDIASFENGYYNLYNSDNVKLLTEVWDKSIKPGDTITMRWSQQFKPQPHSQPPPLPSEAPFSPVPQASVSQLADPPTPLDISEPKASKEQPVTLTFGEKTYSLPFYDCNTWEGMERRIKEICAFQKPGGCYDRQIEAQAYELIYQTRGGDRIILPSSWEKAVEAGWIVKLHMQPLPDPTPDPQSGSTPVPETHPQQSQQLIDTSNQPIYLPDKATKVIVQAVQAKKDPKSNTVVYKFPSPDKPNKYYQTERQDWVSRKIRGTEEECFLYTGKKTGLHFYTMSLDSGSKKRKWD